MDHKRWDISFANLCYGVRGWCDGRRTTAEILKGISGEFRGCELTGVVGMSGSGKTSLLNILSGFTTTNVAGAVRINGDVNGMEIRRRSKYIMQNYKLHHFITVRESMNFAVNFKLCDVSNASKQYKIETIIDDLGLSEKLNELAGNLSGGEQKRLSIALELVDDPSILFLDEPTTGLDSSSSTLCIKLLKKLAQEGKTIICTIHTPSAMLFEMFDHLYALANGCCIYQGSTKYLVPFLADLNLICPEIYNPADFLLEIANNDYGPQNHRLTDSIQNGNNSEYRALNHDDDIVRHKAIECDLPASSPSQFLGQLQQLLIRDFLNATRDKTLTFMRLTIHLVIAILIGIMYKGIGDDASNIFNVYRLLFFNIFILMFTAFSSLQTRFPLDLPIIRREHFNGWYSTAAYYFSLTISDIPIIITTNLIYIVITYFMTNQPLELFRICAYYIVILLTSLTAQGLGLMSGSLMNVKFTLILGSFFICPFVLFSNFFVHMKDTNEAWHFIFQLSFIKHALEGSLLAVFGFDRSKMSCDATYCPYRWPSKFLESLEVTDSLQNVIIKLALFAFVFRFVAFVIVWCRLK